jgi:hypothetical protein
VRQAEALGLFYMPVYVVELFTLAPINYVVLNAMGGKVDFHDAHPMERDAIINSWPWDDPWQKRR